MRKFLFVLSLSVFLFTSQAFASDMLMGAWKSVAINPISGEGPSYVLLIQPDRIHLGRTKTDIIFEEKDGRILIRKPGMTNAFLVIKIIDSNTIEATSNAYLDMKFVRTTESEISQYIRQ